MTEYHLEEVVVMKPVRTGASFTVGAMLGPVVVVSALYLGWKLFGKILDYGADRFGAEEIPVSNLTVNAGVTEVEEYHNVIPGGQAYGQTANNYMKATPIAAFGQNFGGRAF